MPKKTARVSSKKSTPMPQTKSLFSKNQRGILLIAAVALLAIGLGGLFFLREQSRQSQAAFPAEIDVHQAYQLYQQDVLLLDVRTQEEWDQIHVPNATLIPLDQLESRLDELPRDREIVVMCRSGNRSQVGRDMLRKAGFEKVTSMAGGIRDWAAAGYPTVP